MSIFITSDLHLFHDREFIYKPRGFCSVDEMNLTLLQRYNSIVEPTDTVYFLGDVLLGGNKSLEPGIELLSKFNGNKILVRGNHDSNRRIDEFLDKGVFKIVCDAYRFKYRGYHFYLSHYPTITSNLEKESLKQCEINLFGHTHQTTNFYQDIPYMYHCGVDSHDCHPVELDNIITELNHKVSECLNLV